VGDAAGRPVYQRAMSIFGVVSLSCVLVTLAIAKELRQQA
jgi:hypothetical protein